MMKQQFLPFATAAAMMMGSAASADPFVDAIVKNFQDMGYEFVEIERGQTQLKAEGVRGNRELEVVYDLATGRIIRQETGRADDDYIGRSGVEIDTRNRDFVGPGGNDLDDDFDDDNDDDDRSGSSRDDFDDDNDDDDSSSGGSSGGSSRDDNDDDNDDDDSSSGGSSGDDNDDDNDDDDSSGGSDSDSGSDDNDDDNDDDE
jgi:hypothetical protein